MSTDLDEKPAEAVGENESREVEGAEHEVEAEQTEEVPVPEQTDNEEEPDEALVKEAYDKVSEIVVRRVSQTMQDVGEYLLKTFFDDDIAKAQSNSPTKAKSLNALIKKIRKNQGDSPSRTWLYNSVKLVADKRLFEKEGLTEYRELGHSHKVYLTHLEDLDKKRALIKEAVREKYTVAQLRKRIAEEKGDLQVPSLASLPKEKTLVSWPREKLERMYQRAEEGIQKLNDRLGSYREKRDQLKSVIDRKKHEEGQEGESTDQSRAED